MRVCVRKRARSQNRKQRDWNSPVAIARPGRRLPVWTKRRMRGTETDKRAAVPATDSRGRPAARSGQVTEEKKQDPCRARQAGAGRAGQGRDRLTFPQSCHVGATSAVACILGAIVFSPCQSERSPARLAAILPSHLRRDDSPPPHTLFILQTLGGRGRLNCMSCSIPHSMLLSVTRRPQ